MNQPDQPTAGFYLMRLVRGGPWVTVRIWYGPPFDPATGEWCDRSHMWRACVNGEQVSVWKAWPGCSGRPITVEEYRYRRRLSAHVAQHEPDQPEARPRQSVNWSTLRFNF